MTERPLAQSPLQPFSQPLQPLAQPPLQPLAQPLVVGLNIKSAPVEALEALSIHHSINTLRLNELVSAADLRGVVILSTCNRLEFYAVADNLERSVAIMRAFLVGQKTVAQGETSGLAYGFTQDLTQDLTQGPVQLQELQEYVYDYAGVDAIRHLFRVVSGLDSMVLGETEILGQVARAYESARSVNATDKTLNVWFQKALSLGKKVRAEAGIDQYHTSVGRIAVDLAEQELGDLRDKHILILGAGEMSELTMKHLASKAASLVMVSNRSLPKAQALAAEHGFAACPLSELPLRLKTADLVFSATSSKNYLVTYSLLSGIMQTRQHPIVFIDMAVPRDIDPRVAELDGVRCFDIKHLRDVSDKNRVQREKAAALVEAIIDEKLAEFTLWLENAAQESNSGSLQPSAPNSPCSCPSLSCPSCSSSPCPPVSLQRVSPPSVSPQSVLPQSLLPPKRPCFTLRIGTRGSRLALWQAQWVADRLREQHPELTTELVIIKTTGEALLETPLPKIGGKGLFTDEIEAALLDGSIDLAVHSLKDLPNDLPPGLEIGAFCQRVDPRDILVSKNGLSLQELSPRALIGTSSLRRAAQLLNLRSDVRCVDIRGNVETRIQKLDESPDLSGIILAAAGLIHMGCQNRITQYLDEDVFLPAPGQGVIAVEIPTARSDMRALLSSINHRPSEYESRAERRFLATLQGGCQVPIGARAVFADGILTLRGMVGNLNGSEIIRVCASGTNPDFVGEQAAHEALRRGAARILAPNTARILAPDAPQLLAPNPPQILAQNAPPPRNIDERAKQ